VPPTGGAQFVATFATAAEFDAMNYFAGNFIDNNGNRTADLPPWVETPQTINADHDMSCGDPAATSRTLGIADVSQFFYHCLPGGDPAKGHIMTAFDTSGYAIIAFSPNQVMQDVSRVCWDVNATEEGGGKWTNMIVVPEALYQQFAPRLDYVTPGFNADSAPGDFNIQQSDHPASTIWGLKDFRGTLDLFEGDNTLWYSGDTTYTTPDKAQRFTKCVTEIAPGQLEITAARATGETSVYRVAGSFPNGPVRVVFQDDMYNPPKRALYDPNAVTWHWDNIIIN
jgi:hypothetical protein